MESNAVKSDDLLTKRKTKTLLRVLRWSIAIVVAIALIVTIRNATEKLAAHEFSFSSIRWYCVLLAIIAYSLAMFLSCIFWRLVLLAVGCRSSWLETIQAFFVSQLGKYVPGKAMVVIIRTDMIRGEQNDTVTAAASVFVETLTWVFVGSVVACVLMFIEFRDQTTLKWTAGSFALVSGLVTFPPVFRFLAAKLGNRDVSAFADLGYSTLLLGWVILLAGWCLNGLSLWFVLRSFPEVDLGWVDYRLALACVTLATVAGFVSLLPGGLGVRELVMIPLLGPRFGTATAIISAVLIRLVWLSSELLCSAIIYMLGKWLTNR